MSKACERTIGQKIHISRCDDESERCSGSKRPRPRSGSSPSMRPSTTSSTSNAIWSPAEHSALHSAPQDRCPLCVQRMVTTLDHHLLKAYYPVFSVNPLNLVPACADCNKAKLSNYHENPEEVPLHPYYDNIDGDRWLVAAVVQTAPAAMRFYVQPPGVWDPVLAEWLRRHFDELCLATLYGSEAAEELVNIRSQLVGLHGAGEGIWCKRN